MFFFLSLFLVQPLQELNYTFFSVCPGGSWEEWGLTEAVSEVGVMDIHSVESQLDMVAWERHCKAHGAKDRTTAVITPA